MTKIMMTCFRNKKEPTLLYTNLNHNQSCVTLSLLSFTSQMKITTNHFFERVENFKLQIYYSLLGYSYLRAKNSPQIGRLKPSLLVSRYLALSPYTRVKQCYIEYTCTCHHSREVYEEDNLARECPFTPFWVPITSICYFGIRYGIPSLQIHLTSGPLTNEHVARLQYTYTSWEHIAPCPNGL